MITLYSTHCPKCNVLEKKLNIKKLEYTLVEDEDLMVEKGFLSAPMLEVDNQLLTFKEAIEWLENLEE